MSGLKNELKSATTEVNKLLSRYITIHDAIFGFSWRKIIKPIDFNGLHNQAKQVLSELEICNQRISGLIENTEQKESRFAHLLLEYCKALIETVSSLKEILYQLYLKSQNLEDYNLREYNKHCDLYKKAVNKYKSSGSRLNELYSEFDQ